ncbi:hypothetical protein LSCM1_02104 [Leishmania martiniquensis]|uniref:Guanine nucleotide-binding protein subunit beta-like protein n=1 Tax=Leishmania martiniquensis TaxID=1580590 RepID=A0A836GZP3_9TRYP|nr:hypothetical protein LSCM1_02104 [Leishmania martiniquensis]
MPYSAYQVARPTDPFRPMLEMCFRGHRQGVCSVHFQPPPSPSLFIPKVVSGGADGAVMLWDTKSTTRTMRFVGHRGPVLAVSCSPRANLLASGGHDGYVRLWIPNTRRTAATYGLHAEPADDRNSCGWRGHTGATRAVVFAQDGSDYLYTAGNDKAVKCWDLNYASSSHHIGVGPGNKFAGSFAPLSSTGPHGTGHMNWVRTVAVQSAYTSSSFFHYIASGGDDHVICVWETRSRAPVHVLFDCNASVHSLSFHPDGYVLASGDANGAINLFDLRRTSSSPSAAASGGGSTAQRRFSSLLQHYKGAHPGGVQCVDFSPNGGWLLSSGNDSNAKLWDVKQVYLYCTLQGHEGPVKSCHFSEDSRWFATGGSSDKTVLVWRSGLAATVAVSGSTAQAALVVGEEDAAPPAPVPPPSVSFSTDAPALRFSSSMAQASRDATRGRKLREDSLPAHGEAEGSPKTSTSPSTSNGSASRCRGGSSGPSLSSRVAATAAASLGRPPLSLSQAKTAPTGTPAESLSHGMENGSTAKVSGCEVAEEESPAAARERSFERSEHRYTYLAARVPGNGHSPQPPVTERDTMCCGPNALGEEDETLLASVDGTAQGDVAAEEREQEALVAQERAYQRLQEERIIRQRLANLEEALASLAAYMQKQYQQQAKEMHETRVASKAQAEKYDADLADLKRLIAQLAAPAADKIGASGTG